MLREIWFIISLLLFEKEDFWFDVWKVFTLLYYDNFTKVIMMSTCCRLVENMKQNGSFCVITSKHLYLWWLWEFQPSHWIFSFLSLFFFKRGFSFQNITCNVLSSIVACIQISLLIESQAIARKTFSFGYI